MVAVYAMFYKISNILALLLFTVKKQTAQVRITWKNAAILQKCSHAETESQTGFQTCVMLNMKEIH